MFPSSPHWSLRARRSAPWLVVLAFTLVAAAGHAAPLALDPRAWTTDGAVNAVVHSGGTVYLGGRFSHVAPFTGGLVALDAASGSCLPGWPLFEGSVSSLAADGAGGWYVGGGFTAVGGAPRSYLVHLRSDLTLDDWNPAPNGNVTSIVVSGSTVYVAGAFMSIGGEARAGLAAIDAATGRATAWNPDPDGIVLTIAGGHSLEYAGGYFSSIGGQSRAGLAALDSTSGLASAWDPVGTGSAAVQSIAVDGDKVYVAGGFAEIGGAVRAGIAALDAATGLATPWAPEVDGPAFALVPHGGSVYLGGTFTTVGGQPRAYVAQVGAVTGAVTAWNPGAAGGMYYTAVRSIVAEAGTVRVAGDFTSMGGAAQSFVAEVDSASGLSTAWAPWVNGPASALVVSGGRVVTGGEFSAAGGAPRANLAAVDALTGVATDWAPVTDGAVNAIAVSPSAIYAGGVFRNAGGLPRSRVAAFDPATGQPTAWNPVVSGTLPADSASVSALAVHDTSVYVGGTFVRIGGQDRKGLAAVGAGTGLATGWNPGVAGGYVYALAPTDAALYAGGTFSVSIDALLWRKLAAFDWNTGLPTDWRPVPSGTVRAIEITGSTLHAGGAFTTMNNASRPRLAGFDLGTGALTDWNPGASGEGPLGVTALALHGDAVYAGGDFYTAGGQVGALAAISAATGAGFEWGFQLAPTVLALAVSGPALFVGGSYSGVGVLTRTGFAVFRDADHTAPAVEVLPPDGGGPLRIGQDRQLRWSATDASGVRSVDLYLSRSGPTGPWALLAAAVPNTGSWTWRVTEPEVLAMDAYLRVEARDVYGNTAGDVGDAGFAIVPSWLGVAPDGAASRVTLSPPAPNPAAHRTLVRFALPVGTHMRLSVVDVQGREVAVIRDGPLPAGLHDAPIETGALRAGVYFVRLRTPGADRVRRLAIVH